MDRIHPQLLTRLKKEILDRDTDFTAENLVLWLMQSGLRREQILVTGRGSAKRSYRKEVSGFRTEISSFDNAEYLYLETNREGIYDGLPEGMFHLPANGRQSRSKLDTMEEIKRHREEEAAARRFFLPFEAGFQQLKVFLKEAEADFDMPRALQVLPELFAPLWPVLKKLEPGSGVLFLRMIPFLNEVRNDFEAVSECLSLLLGVPVEVFQVPVKHTTGPLYFGGSALGTCTLGADMVTAGWPEEEEFAAEVRIGPLVPEKLDAFLPGAGNDLLLNELLGYFIGVDYEVVKKLLVPEEEKMLVLDKGCVLGVSSYLL